MIEVHDAPPVLVELFAGSAALTRHVVGAPSRLVSWLGGKLRVADTLARTLDLSSRAELGGVLLCDAGPWGWVWPVLLDASSRAQVVQVLRRWATTCPACDGAGRVQGGTCRTCARSKAGPGGGPDASDLWAWLASQPPRVDVAERTAGWLWLQSRSAVGAACWFDDLEHWRMGEDHGRRHQRIQEMRENAGIRLVSTLASRIDGLSFARWPAPSDALAEVVAAWVVLQSGSARGRPVDIEGGEWQTAGYAHLTPSARDKGFTSRLHLPRISDRVARLEEGAWPSVACVHGSALDALPLALALGRRARVLLDPPYHRDGDTDRDRTGYGADLPLADTLQMAAQLDDVGALVTICEGGPLARDLGPGWYSYDYSSHFSGRVVGREWVTCNRRQPFLDGAAQQRLFPVG